MVAIGHTLKKLRIEKGWTQKEVAEELHISYQTVSKWELDKSQPSLEMMVAISQLYNTSIDTIIFGQNMQTNVSIWQKIFKGKWSDMNSPKSINRKQFFNDIINQGGVMACFYVNDEIIPYDTEVQWIVSLNETTVLSIMNKVSKEVTKIEFGDIDNVSLCLAKRFLGEAPGLFFTQTIVLEVTLFLKNRQQIVFLTNSFQILNQLTQYFCMQQVKVVDKLDLEALIKNKSEEDLTQYMYDHYEDLLASASINPATQFYKSL